MVLRHDGSFPPPTTSGDFESDVCASSIPAASRCDDDAIMLLPGKDAKGERDEEKPDDDSEFDEDSDLDEELFDEEDDDIDFDEDLDPPGADEEVD